MKENIKLTRFSSCAGWACKLSPEDLSQVLRNLNNADTDNIQIDFSSFDDAAAFNIDKTTILQTVDFFTPIVDNPYDFGRIAAANSLSDIYAMGGEPKFALNIVAFPSDDLSMDILTEILRGGAKITSEAGIPILGGHSIKDKEPKYGLVVTGVPNRHPIKNSTANIGDSLILTKPLGLGVISTAIKKEIATEKMINDAVRIMTTLNKTASEIMTQVGVSACTDITGYGLLGHLLEMCKGSRVSANIEFDKIDFIDGAIKCALDGIIPGGTKRNYEFVKEYIAFSEDLNQTEKYLLADAQTSGGLLISVPNDKCNELNNMLLESNCSSMKIGKIEELKNNKYITVKWKI